MLKITGYSDDNISITGDIREEFSRYDSEGDYLAFSDGTVLKAFYDEDGIWRFSLIFRGRLYQSKEDGNVADDINDVVTFGDGIKWVVCGEDLGK
jgi:hypothetical protein